MRRTTAERKHIAGGPLWSRAARVSCPLRIWPSSSSCWSPAGSRDRASGAHRAPAAGARRSRRTSCRSSSGPVRAVTVRARRAPMSLMTYADVRPWARVDQAEGRERARCRPGTSTGASASTSTDPSLSDEEIALIGAWVDGGAPEGRAADAPPALTFAASTEWTYGEPDLIVRMAKGFKIPADGPDFTPDEVVDPGLTEDRYVKWVQIIPDAHARRAPRARLRRPARRRRHRAASGSAWDRTSATRWT